MTMIKICALSDPHGHLPKIDKCDLVLIAGDISPLDVQFNKVEWHKWFQSGFLSWCDEIPCDKIIFIAGNHDLILEQLGYDSVLKLIAGHNLSDKLVYLLNNSYDHEGLTIYGNPYVTNLPNWSFNLYESCYNYRGIYNDIPKDCDILLCHNSPNIGEVGVSHFKTRSVNYGSNELAKTIEDSNIKYIFCGHIHSGDHGLTKCNDTNIYNVSIMDENYNPSYKPLYLIVPDGQNT